MIDSQPIASQPTDATQSPTDTPPRSESEAAIVQRYDLQRRQRLLIMLGTAFGGTIGLLFLALLASIILFPNSTDSSTGNLSTLLGTALNAALYGVTVYAAHKGRVGLATGLFAIGAGVIPNLNVLLNGYTRGPDPFSVVFLIGAIVIIGTVGTPRMIIGTTILSSLTTTLMLFFMPVPAFLKTLYAADRPGIYPVLLVTYWALTAIILLNWRSYQQTLLDLADVRVQIERARQLDELKDQFIRNVNHELRTPIMAVLGYIDLLMNPKHRASAEKTDRFIKNAQRSGQSLRTLLASILDTRRLDLNALEYQPERVAFFAALEDVIPLIPVEQHEGQIIERALHVHMSPDLAVWADPTILQQVLLNVLSNAVKYSLPGTAVDIAAKPVIVSESAERSWRRTEKRERQMVEISIRDYGFGIPPEQIPLLFQRFVRLPRDLESNIVGTGLGLYLCRTLMEKMGGSIRVESTGVPGEGSTFLLNVPLPPAENDAPAATPAIMIERRTGPLVANDTALAALHAITASTSEANSR